MPTTTTRRRPRLPSVDDDDDYDDDDYNDNDEDNFDRNDHSHHRFTMENNPPKLPIRRQGQNDDKEEEEDEDDQKDDERLVLVSAMKQQSWTVYSLPSDEDKKRQQQQMETTAEAPPTTLQHDSMMVGISSPPPFSSAQVSSFATPIDTIRNKKEEDAASNTTSIRQELPPPVDSGFWSLQEQKSQLYDLEDPKEMPIVTTTRSTLIVPASSCVDGRTAGAAGGDAGISILGGADVSELTMDKLFKEEPSSFVAPTVDALDSRTIQVPSVRISLFEDHISELTISRVEESSMVPPTVSLVSRTIEIPAHNTDGGSVGVGGGGGISVYGDTTVSELTPPVEKRFFGFPPPVPLYPVLATVDLDTKIEKGQITNQAAKEDQITTPEDESWKGGDDIVVATKEGMQASLVFLRWYRCIRFLLLSILILRSKKDRLPIRQQKKIISQRLKTNLGRVVMISSSRRRKECKRKGGRRRALLLPPLGSVLNTPDVPWPSLLY